MAGINQLESLRVLKAVVESGSFTAAAGRLKISAARVSKSIERLEEELETTLFKRSTRHMQITDSGERCYRQALTLLGQWKALRDELTETQASPQGKLRISAPMTWGLCHLAPLLTEFMTMYPQIRLDIQLNDQHVNVLEGEYDLVLRLSRQLADSALLCQRITQYRYIACATPEYLAENGTPLHPQELKQHACLIYLNPGATPKWQFFQDGKTLDLYIDPYLQSNNSKLLHTALLAGQGIMLIPEFMVGEDLANGRLKPIFTDFDTEALSLFALRPKDHMAPHRLKLLQDFLYQRLNQAG